MSGLTHRAAVGADRVADAELQADVMRFVAILALCLVGISTLVERAGEKPAAQTRAPAPVAVAPDVSEEPIGPEPRSAGERVASPPPGPGGKESIKTGPVSSPHSPIGLPVVGDAGSVASIAASAAPINEQRAHPEKAPDDRRGGLTLRFESDAALLRMVGRGEAGVFVMSGQQVVMLDVGGGVEFAPAPAPSRMHVITPATVPALLRGGYHGPPDAIWGVTLPGATLEAMRPFIERGDEGVLVIGGDGSVRLESADG